MTDITVHAVSVWQRKPVNTQEKLKLVKAAYILSAGHSGSTMLDLMVGSHPSTVAVSELTHLPKNVSHDEPCTCGRTVRQCHVWNGVFARIRAGGGADILREPYAFDLGYIGEKRPKYRDDLGARYRAVWQLRRAAAYFSLATGCELPLFLGSRFRQTIDNRLAMYEAIRAETRSSVVIDASKEYLTGLSLYRLRPDEVRLILLVRDGRAVFYSNLKRGFGRKYSLDAWNKYYRHSLPLLTRIVPAQHKLTVCYENLVRDTQTQLRRVAEFLGLQFEAAMLDSGAKQHHITSGNNMRFNSGAAIRPDTQWQTALQPADLRYFEKHAGSLNRRLGYE